MFLRRVIRLIPLLLAVAIALPSVPGNAQSADDQALPGGQGWFYTQARGEKPAGVGYAVYDDSKAQMYTWFRKFGGAAVIGYPVSHRFMWGGFVAQAFQKAVFQWRPEADTVYFVNVFDELSKAGKDDTMVTVRNIPKSADWTSDGGKEWPQVVENHYKLLDPYPAIKALYLASPDPVNLNGLPMGTQEYSNVSVVRAQRLVFQQWKIDVPWAKAGQVQVANGGDVGKEFDMYPKVSTEPVPITAAIIATLPVVGDTPPAVQPPAAQPPAGQPPVVQPPTGQPAPLQPGLQFRGAGTSYLRNCALTQLKVYVKDAGGNAVNDIRAKVEWDGLNGEGITTNPTGKPGAYDAGWTDAILNASGMTANNWRVWLIDGSNNRISEIVTFQTNTDCSSDNAHQIATVNFQRVT